MRLFHIVATLFAVSSFALAGCAADTDGNDPAANDQHITQGGEASNDLSRIHAPTDLSRFEKNDRARIDDPSIAYNVGGEPRFDEQLTKLPAERREVTATAMGQH